MLRLTDLTETAILTDREMHNIIGASRGRRTRVATVNAEPPTAHTNGSMPRYTVEEETQMRAEHMGSGFLSGFASSAL